MITDTNWIETVLDTYEKPLVRYVTHILKDSELAKEVVQDSFLKLCKENKETIEDHVAEWLFTVCRNASFDIYKRRKKMNPLIENEDSQVTDISKDIHSTLEKKEEAKTALNILATLPINQQECIRLKFQNGFSYSEISEITNFSESNIGFLIHTGLKTIREILKERGEQ